MMYEKNFQIQDLKSNFEIFTEQENLQSIFNADRLRSVCEGLFHCPLRNFGLLIEN